jgi:hypothetical protein
MNDWIATALGLAGGAALTWSIGAAALTPLMQRSSAPDRVVRLAFAGGLVMALPAVVLSIVLGLTLGGAIGVAVVFALIMLAGLFAGALLGRRPRR